MRPHLSGAQGSGISRAKTARLPFSALGLVNGPWHFFSRASRARYGPPSLIWRLATSRKREFCNPERPRVKRASGNLHQFHLAVAPAMEHKHVSGGSAEDQQVAVAELGVLHRFLDGHGPQRDRLAVLHDVRLDHRRADGEGMHRDDARVLEGRAGLVSPASAAVGGRAPWAAPREAPSEPSLSWAAACSPAAGPGSAAPGSRRARWPAGAPLPACRPYPWPQSYAAAPAPSTPRSARAAAR